MTDVEMTYTRDNYKVEWVDIGEGWCGDYDPTDPDDTPLLRFDVYRLVQTLRGEEWEPMDDASYCTAMPVHTDTMTLHRGLEAIMEAVYGKDSVKRVCEELSWMSPAWFD